MLTDRNDLSPHIDLGFTREEVAQRTDIRTGNVLVSIRNKVYNVGPYLSIATEQQGTNIVLRNTTAFFVDSFTQLLIRNVGGDITNGILSIPGNDDLARCMDRLFLAGVMQPDSSSLTASCNLLNPTLYAMFGPALLVLLVQAFFAFGFHLSKNTDLCDAYVIALVPCYAEPQNLLKRSIDSVAASVYRHDRKVLFVVCDGEVKEAKTTIPTYRLLLQMLQYKGLETPLCSYPSVGEGAKAVNRARCYSGIYSLEEGIQIPYVLLVKFGSSDIDNGNRGKRDSQLLLLRFLHRAMRPDIPMCPLDYELYQHFQDRLSMDPRRFEYFMALDADTMMGGTTLLNLVTELDQQPRTAVVCARTEASNALQSPLTWLQAYPLFLTHHLGMRFASAFGTLSSTPGNCTVYRLKYIDGSSCLLTEEFMQAYQLQPMGPQTMHTKNAYWLGEDRTAILAMKQTTKDQRVSYIPSAVVYTTLPSGLMAMFRQRIRWYNAAFHVKWEAVLGNGKIDFGTRLWSLISAMFMLLMPAFTGYLYFLAIQFLLAHLGVSLPFSASSFGPTVWSNGLLVGAFLVVPVIHLVALLIQFRFAFLLYIPIFLVVGAPLFMMMVPAFAIWNWDSLEWSDTFASLKAKTKRAHGAQDSDLPSRSGTTNLPTIPYMSAREWKAKGGVKDNMDGPEILIEQPSSKFVNMSMESTPPPVAASVPAAQGRKTKPKQSRRPSDSNTPTTGQRHQPISSYSQQDIQPLSFASESDFNGALPMLADVSAAVLPLPIRERKLVGGDNSSSSSLNEVKNKQRSDKKTDVARAEMLLSMASSEPKTRRPYSTYSLAEDNTPIGTLHAGQVAKYFPRKSTATSNAATAPSNGSTPSAAPNVIYQPTNFREDRPQPSRRPPVTSELGPLSPMRAVSMARSDYYSDYEPSELGGGSRTDGGRSTMMTMMTDGISLAEEEIEELAGGLTKEEIREEIWFLLQDADLNQVTRREVKEHLYAQYGEAVEYYNDYMNHCIEEYTLEKLALL